MSRALRFRALILCCLWWKSLEKKIRKNNYEKYKASARNCGISLISRGASLGVVFGMAHGYSRQKLTEDGDNLISIDPTRAENSIWRDLNEERCHDFLMKYSWLQQLFGLWINASPPINGPLILRKPPEWEPHGQNSIFTGGNPRPTSTTWYYARAHALNQNPAQFGPNFRQGSNKALSPPSDCFLSFGWL